MAKKKGEIGSKMSECQTTQSAAKIRATPFFQPLFSIVFLKNKKFKYIAQEK
jgi:hypothetical protein